MTALNPLGAAAAEACGLSAAPRMRYWKPAPALAPYVSGYHLYAVSTPAGQPHLDVFQPAWANLRIRLSTGSRWRVRVRDGEWQSPGRVTLFGPSSAVTWSESESGMIVGAGILPRGWNRLFAGAARDWANRIGELPSLGGQTAAEMHAQFCDLHDEETVPQMFDRLLLSALRPGGADDEAIAAMEAALVDPMIDSVKALSETTGIPVRALERLSRRAFGFPPKLLMRRARFLRSLHAIRDRAPTGRTAAIDPGYSDYSHFVRDSHAFLGMSPQAFLRLDTPLLKESLALRQQVLGASAQALARSWPGHIAGPR
jgi:AraC-like DNA-binding protein